MIYPGNKSTWMTRDEEIFGALNFEVKSSSFPIYPKYVLPLSFFKQFFQFLFNQRKFSYIVCQGGGYHSFLPAILNRIFKGKVIVIAVGTDCVNYPSIDYGNFRKNLYRYFTSKSFLHATIICPVHQSLIQYENTFYPVDPSYQGLKTFIPKLEENKLKVINYGFDMTKWPYMGKDRLPHSYLTVVGEINERTTPLKGIDLLIDYFKSNPESTLTIVGRMNCNLDFPDNIKLIPFVKQDELKEIYNEHQYYFQLSISEGLPNTLCEAMLCGCIPIGSSNSSIPEIIGREENVLLKKDVEALKALIQKLPEYNEEDALYFRQRILTNYPIKKRLEDFKNLFATHQ